MFCGAKVYDATEAVLDTEGRKMCLEKIQQSSDFIYNILITWMAA